MKVPYSYLKEQFKEPGRIFTALKDVLKRCEFSLGKELKEFENKITAYTGAKYALGTSSGTAAISMLLRASGVGWGDEVITVSQTFIATVGAIVAVGAKPYFVDVKDDFTMDPGLIEKAITPKSRAILPVHYSGNPADMRQIVKIAARHGLSVIEDACCAIGASIDGTHVGNFGNSGAFSVHPLKNLNVWGDGGFIITNSKEIYEKVLLLRNHGLKNRDEAEIFGYNARLDTIQAAVANQLFTQVDEITEKRIRNASRYDKAFSSAGLRPFITVPPRGKQAKHTYHMYMLLVKKRDALLKYLTKRGIEAKVHYPIPVHLQRACKGMAESFGMTDLSRTVSQCGSLITLPVHQYLSEKQIDYVIRSVEGFYGRKLFR